MKRSAKRPGFTCPCLCRIVATGSDDQEVGKHERVQTRIQHDDTGDDPGSHRHQHRRRATGAADQGAAVPGLDRHHPGGRARRPVGRGADRFPVQCRLDSGRLVHTRLRIRRRGSDHRCAGRRVWASRMAERVVEGDPGRPDYRATRRHPVGADRHLRFRRRDGQRHGCHCRLGALHRAGLRWAPTSPRGHSPTRWTRWRPI